MDTFQQHPSSTRYTTKDFCATSVSSDSESSALTFPKEVCIPDTMNEVGRVSFDENNNVNEAQNNSKSSSPYVERHLELGNEGEGFLVIPNGGSGDCMFKAVSQAVNQGDESKHREIRKRVVNFIISHRWEKFSESIEVQHINGNSLLQRQWAKDPKEAYKMYMSLAGTLGSSSELTAAGELFHYNFATIQEYCSSTQNTYRVENCVLFDESVTDFHYFYFTGDYDNGHWEYIKKFTDKKLEDGTYQGRHKIVISGEEISFENWLRRETENNNDADQLKIATNHDLYMRRRTTHPFELRGFHFSRDGTVQLKGNSFTIAPVQRSDLFSVLAHECMKNEASAHDIELILMKHRYSYFEDLNYKLITQPWSHNFTVDAIRYCGQPLKGNIQDLISAADLYSFSFILFVKMSDDEDTHQCKFTHVDRWGGESDRILYFFMRLSRANNGEQEQLIAKWWRLIPVDGNSPCSSDAKLFSRKSISRLEGGDSNLSRKSNSTRTSTTYVVGRPATADCFGVYDNMQASRISSQRPASVQGNSGRMDSAPRLDTAQDILVGAAMAARAQVEPKIQVLEGGITVTRISGSDGGMETDECLQKDHAKIFGSRPVSRKSSVMDTKPTWTQMQKPTRLVKKDMNEERIKPATGRDLLKHPEKVKTLVKISDRSNAGRELTYRGSGYMEADDVLTDLRSQGLIRMSTALPGRASSFTARSKQREMPLQRLLSAGAGAYHTQQQYDDLLVMRDENFNIVSNKKEEEEEENEGSDISYETFKPPSLETQVSVMQNGNVYRQVSSQGQQFPPRDLLPVAMEASRSKINKVAPKPNETYGMNPYEQEYNQRNSCTHNRDNKNPCLQWLVQSLTRIVDGLRNVTRRIQRGFIRTYEGYNDPSSIINKRQKQFPHSRHY